MKNISKKPKSLVLSIAFFLSACSGIDPKTMESAVGVEPIQLTQTYEFFWSAPTGARFKYAIEPGTFVPTVRDSTGIYYNGPPLCLRAIVVDVSWTIKPEYLNKIYSMAHCGIFIPNNLHQSAKIFAVIGSHIGPEQIQQRQENTSNWAAIYAATGVFKPPMATGVQAGLGTGIGFAVAGALAEAENGRFSFVPTGDNTMRLREMVTKSAISTTPAAPPVQ